jgi:flagellar basal-body rod modification protein FlgD
MSIADIINGTSSTSGTSNTGSTTGTKKKDKLGQDEFLKLMLAQLKNQDPMKAMDPSQFLGQLAQFSTVSGIQGMQAAFTTMSDSMRASQVLDGATMVGRDVLVASEDVTIGAEGTVRGALDVPTGANSVTINVLDSAGQIVRTIPATTTTGLNEFTWDGTADNGAHVSAGEYTFEAVAKVGGQNIELETLLSDRVNSVTIDSAKGLTLNTSGLGARALSDVRRVM